MFKQVKSALFWYYLFKFRKKVILIAFLLLIALFANAIYSDIIEYLTLKEKLEFLEIAIISKWLIIIFSIIYSIYLLIGLFKPGKNDKSIKKNENINKNNDIIQKQKENTSKFTKREEKFLKKNIKSKADLLVER